MRHIGCVAAAALFLISCGPKASTGDDGGDDTPSPDASGIPHGPDAPACASDHVAADEFVRPVDILWVIDNSGSMDEEEARVQNNMNAFATSIATSGTDYHVIVIADASHVNVPPPLGGSPEFLAVNVSIDSHNAFQKVVETYPTYQAFLRASSVKHIVVVSDDESDWSQATFETQLAALTGPGFGTDWRLHAVVAEAPPWDWTSHCFTLAADIGATYMATQADHDGLFFSLCDTDWSPLFTALAESVIQGLSLPCVFDLPAPPDRSSLDPTHVNFVYTPTSGPAVTLPNVGSLAGCAGNGWYYDNPAAPTQIIVCPSTCTTLEGDATGMVSVEFGCATIIE